MAARDFDIEIGGITYTKIQLNRIARRAVVGPFRRWLRWKLVVPGFGPVHLVAQYECRKTKRVISERIPLTAKGSPMSLEQLEQRALQLTDSCVVASGREEYGELDGLRKVVLPEIEKHRPLTREEYINCHGYLAWSFWCEENGVPEDHPVAEQNKAVRI